MKMEMSGKEAKGVELLKKALEKARKEGKGHEVYEIEMLLVEMLIYLVCSLISFFIYMILFFHHLYNNLFI